MIEKPRLSAQEMAEYGMIPSFLNSTRTELLVHLEKVNGKPYADEVRKLMELIYRKRRGNK